MTLFHNKRVAGSQYHCPQCGRHWDLDDMPADDEVCDQSLSDISSLLMPPSSRLPNKKPKYINTRNHRRA